MLLDSFQCSHEDREPHTIPRGAVARSTQYITRPNVGEGEGDPLSPHRRGCEA